MKILLVGQFKEWAIENHYARHLRKHADVCIYPAEEVFDDYYHSSLKNKLIYKLGLSAIYEKIESELLEHVKAEKPDVVWIFKGMRITANAISQLKELDVKIVNYNPDHPFFFSSKGSGNKNVTKSIGLYDMHLCYSRELMVRIEREYGIPTAFLPFAYELEEEIYESVKDEKEIAKACFIGNPDKIRKDYILTLARSGTPVDIYGYRWNRYLQNEKNITVHPLIHGSKFWKTMRAYRLQINIFRPHNEGSHNMRTFEVPAAGGIMLAPDSPEHREFFEVGKEIFVYQNKNEMLEKASYILGLSKEEAAIIRQQARAKSCQAGYTYANRAKDAYKAFQSIVPSKVTSL